MAALLRLRRAGVVASPPVTPGYSAIPLPPTLRGRSGCYTLSAVSHQPNSLAGLFGPAFPSFPLSGGGGAGLGHFSPGAGHVFRFSSQKAPFQEGWPIRTNGKFPERSACPVVSMPFGRQNPTLRLPFACLLLGPSFGPARQPPRAVPAFPLVVPSTLACRLGSEGYPSRHQWVRWYGPGPWAPPQVFLLDPPRFTLARRLSDAEGVFARSRTFVTGPG